MSAFHFTRIQKFEKLINSKYALSFITNNALQRVHYTCFITFYNTSRTSEYLTTSFSPYYGHAKITVSSERLRGSTSCKTIGFDKSFNQRDHILLKLLDQCWAQNIEKTINFCWIWSVCLTWYLSSCLILDRNIRSTHIFIPSFLPKPMVREDSIILTFDVPPLANGLFDIDRV